MQRLRGYAYDPKAYFNYNATPLSLHLKRGNNPSRVLAINKNNSQIEATINYIIQNNIDLAPDYNEYLNLAFCFSYEYGPGGVDYFLKVCSTHSKYNEREAIQKFNSALRDNKGLVRMGSFFHLCGLKGIDYKNLGSSSIKSSDHTRKINPLKQGLLQKGNVFQNTTNHVKELSTITVNNIEQTEKYELFYYEKDLINMLNNANLKIRDPKYLKWIEKEINKLIEMRSPKRKSDPDIKQLIDSINSI
ncbi:MAG: PriCT-2 domain-containing protein [Saprospiraceae bacterium]|nr:PriCT-2 domain-containing protein [Candidatus Brachybacter algidus]MBK8746363.1 PriCT-2 domain-containing protein [Candidatus Brachybacter algidus]